MDDSDDYIHAFENLCGICFGCPKGTSRSPDCPLVDLETIEPKERIMWLKGLNLK